MNKDYEKIEINLDINTFIKIALLAHKNNVTFNTMVNRILKETLKDE